MVPGTGNCVEKLDWRTPHFWHCAGMVGDSGQLGEHEFTGETGPHGSVDEFNNHLLVWFEIVWINHSSRIIFITSLIIVIIYY